MSVASAATQRLSRAPVPPSFGACEPTRPAHAATAQVAYTTGVVLVRCPGCRNLHLVADHLGYFDDGDGVANGSGRGGGGGSGIDVESIMRARGEAVRTGRIGDGSADAFVTELTPADAAVLASPTKSVSLATGAPVTEEYERRPGGSPPGAFSIGAATVATPAVASASAAAAAALPPGDASSGRPR